jgi:two-component system, NtrC family, sensor kinase
MAASGSRRYDCGETIYAGVRQGLTMNDSRTISFPRNQARHVDDAPPHLEKAVMEDLHVQGPSISFRMQIILGFMIFFLLSVTITVGAMTIINRIQHRIVAFQTWELFLFHIEQARRWEKNFFLYGTNLEDALASVAEARTLLEENKEILLDTSPPLPQEQLLSPLTAYSSLLDELEHTMKNQASFSEHGQHIEAGLREHGAVIVQQAVTMANKENDQINRWMTLIQKIPLYFLAFLFILMSYTSYYLSQRFMKPLNNLIDSTKRIARGDFNRIKPVSRFQDEFVTVVDAINRMLKELEARQNSLIESHKLRAVGILTAGVAHEINNPLNNIMLTSHSMLEEFKDLTPQEHMEMIRDIIQETDRSRNIVRNLLDFTRESTSLMEPLELGPLLESTVKLALNQAKVSGTQITLEVEPSLPSIQGDNQQLQQVFLNLILNALDAMDQAGLVCVTATRAPEDGFLRVHIQDNGSGIPDSVLPHIFDPFFTTKPIGKGTGLGLCVSLGIIIKHGGRIEVNSEPDLYTVFTIILPSDEPYTGNRHRMISSCYRN